VLQWRGIRGGTREATFEGAGTFSLEVTIAIPVNGKARTAIYSITVDVPKDGKTVRVLRERLKVEGESQPVLDAWLDRARNRQLDVILKKSRSLQRAEIERLDGLTDRPTLSQFADDKRASREVREYVELTLEALRSMRFLDLSPEAMRLPSIPGQVVLGDRGENLSTVLQAICEDAAKKKAITGWLRQLTPLDVVDFDFAQDVAGRVQLALIEADGRHVSANSASDGTLRFLSMIAAFLGPDPARFYFLEELETGLHPTRLSLLLELIETQTSRRVSQVVATTHSPQLLMLPSERSLESAILAYRLRGHRDQRLTRIVDLPDARRVLKSQDLMRLHSTGWLEDATEFAEPESDRKATGVTG
jgi:predicted ATPase